MSDTVSPFSSGIQYMSWTSNNCDTCAKGWREDRDSLCDIADALAFAALDDGRIPLALAERMGATKGTCREHEPTED